MDRPQPLYVSKNKIRRNDHPAGSYVTILKITADGNTTPTHLTNLENPTSMIMAYALRFTYHAWHG